VGYKGLFIKIEDNGRGFRASEVRGDHLGLSIMRERVASVEGTIRLDSKPGLGTKIEIEIPRQKRGIVHRRVK
jgi:signal transduction histidine kinase